MVATALFIDLRRVFDRDLLARSGRSRFRDRVMAYYAPIGLLLLPVTWVTMVLVGYTAIFWGTGIDPLAEAFAISGSSLFTLGFDRPGDIGHIVVSFAEAFMGLGIVALVISYLPSIYGAFARREALVGKLEVRAGLPPSPAELLTRYAAHRLAGPDRRGAVRRLGDLVRRDRGEPHQPSRARTSCARPIPGGAGSPPPAACSTRPPSPTPSVAKPHDAEGRHHVADRVLLPAAHRGLLRPPLRPRSPARRPDLRLPWGVRPAVRWSSRRPGCR